VSTLDAAQGSKDERAFTFTAGNSQTQKVWDQRRTLAWPELVGVLTAHTQGPKEGACIVPAVFRGTDRKKDEAAQIDVAFLDSDSGASLAEIEAAVKSRGWTAVISSTHSHMTTQTKTKRSHWDRFCADNPDGTAADFLRREKHYVAGVAAGAILIENDDADYVLIQHRPCPKFRVAIPLMKPWLASDYRSQSEANLAWNQRIEALAEALRLDHDQSCTDTSRLFYLPRRPPNGAAAETSVIAGTFCDIFGLPAAPPPENLFTATAERGETKRRQWTDGRPNYTDPIQGEVINLASWAHGFGDRFLIAKALHTRKPGVFTGLRADNSKVHIDCPNGDAHTEPGRDNATFVVNAGQSENKGFVIHCRHGHCTDLDRAFMVKRMLEQDWLAPEDLMDARFLLQTEEAQRRENTGNRTSNVLPPGGGAEAAPSALWHSDDEWVEAAIPPRPWIVERYIMRETCTALAGAPSAGKSSLLKAWTVSMLLNRPYGNFRPAGPCRVLSYNVEDDLDEEHMRLSAILRWFGAASKDLDGKLRIVGPNQVGTLVERDLSTGRLRTTAAMDALEVMIEEFKPDVLMLDPFVELHTTEENDNTGLRSVIAHFRTLAKRHGVGIVLAHHTRKGAMAPGDPDAIRGAGSIVGAVRVAMTVCTMSEDEADQFGIPKAMRKHYFRVDGAKANYAPLGDADWFKRHAYELDNGEMVAAALPWSPPANDTNENVLDEIKAAIAKGIGGEPYTFAGQAGGRSLKQLCIRHGITTAGGQNKVTAVLKASGFVSALYRRGNRGTAQGIQTPDGAPSTVPWLKHGDAGE
jgi:hypothetical protein